MDLPDVRPIGELLRDTPRGGSIRMSLDRVRVQDVGLSRLASSSDRAEQRQAYGIAEPDAAVAPPSEQVPACWGHQDASHRLLHTDVDSQASSYSSEEFNIAATLCAAEIQASQQSQLLELELRIFNSAISANELVTSWWAGRQLGLPRFLAGTGKSDGAV